MLRRYRKGSSRFVKCDECQTAHQLLAPDYRRVAGAMGPTTPWCLCPDPMTTRDPSGPMTIKPGDQVTITDRDDPSLSVTRTVHSLTFDLEADGLNTTQGDWFAFDDWLIERP